MARTINSLLSAVGLSLMMLAVYEDNSVLCTKTKKMLFDKQAAKFLETGVLPFNQQVSTHLLKGSPKIFLVLDVERLNHPLSITLVPCSSSIHWFIRYRPENETGLVNRSEVLEPSAVRDKRMDQEYTGVELHTIKIDNANTGLYIIQVTTLEKDTYVHMFATMDPGGPYDLTIPQDARLRVLIHRRKKAMSVRWEPSLVNPQTTNYCLVVNTRREYRSLCEAQGEKDGVAPSATNYNYHTNNVEIHNNKRIGMSRSERGNMDTRHSDIKIACVKKRTSFTLHNLTQGRDYFFDLFATNTDTRLTIPYGSLVTKYDTTPKFVTLKDGVPVTAYLKKYEGRLSFRFKVGEVADELHFYIMPCGGSVKTQVQAHREVIKKTIPVHGYQRIKINRPVLGQKYVLKVASLNVDELSQTKKIEVFATLHPMQRFPLPEIPDEPIVYEYEGSRRCDTVTIGWVPARDIQPTKYCVYVTEMTSNEADTLDITDQCSFSKGNSRRGKYWYKNCNNIEVDNRNRVLVTTHTITDMKPGKSYMIQVTGKKKDGRTLSYRLLKVTTKSSCE